MLLALVAPAFALTVPLRATYREEIVPGEVAIASYATTAAVTGVSNPASGVAFTVSGDELTANKREASGKVALSFFASPADSVRSWAVYFLDADGYELGSPEIVEMSFDSLGNGSVAARGGSTRLASLLVKPGGTATGGFYGATTKVAVQDSGADAAFVGIVELTNKVEGSNLATDPDMRVMDTTVFAAFQALDLDAIVPLDTYTIQLEGTVELGGVSIASTGAVEGGGELQWDIGFQDGGVSCEKDGACTPNIASSLSYLEPIGTIKKKSSVPPRVNLRDSDVVVDSVDASFQLTIGGDVRNLEVAAAMDVYQQGKLADGRDVVALDPGGYGVEGKASKDKDDTGMIIDIFIDVDTDVLDGLDNVSNPPPWAPMTQTVFEVVVTDSDGGVVSTHSCQLSPTGATLAGTSPRAILVGQCTHAEEGTEVRRLRASIGDAGWVTWTIDLAGSAFVEERVETTCSKEGTCTERTVSVLGGRVELQEGGHPLLSRALAVTETDFDLPFLYDWDISDLDTTVAIDLYTAFPVYWSVLDGVVTAKDGETVVASFDVEDVGLAPTGDCKLKGWAVDGAAAPVEKSAGPVVLANTGPGRHRCD